VGAPAGVSDFLGGAGSESPGYDRYPTTKTALLAAAREELADADDGGAAAVGWIAQRLPDGTYRDRGDVFRATFPVLEASAPEAGGWWTTLPVQAVPLGARLHVVPGAVAILVGRGSAPFDVKAAGDHVLTRETCPLAAAGSRAPAPGGDARAVLDARITVFAVREIVATLSTSARTRSGAPYVVFATIRCTVSDPAKLVVSVVRSFSETAHVETVIARLVGASLTKVVGEREGAQLAGDHGPVEEAIRSALTAAGFGVGAVAFGPPAPGPGAGIPGDPFAHLPPEVRARVQAQMEEAMRRRAAARAGPAGTLPPPPPAPSATTAPAPSPPRPPAPPTAAPTAVRCPACQAPNSSGAKFCCACGAPLPTARRCVACGTELAPSVKFCGNCGTRAP
jgi:hypothetical protein